MLQEFYGWSEADLLVAMRKTQEAIASGVTVVNIGTGDINTGLQQNTKPRETLALIQKALYQLDSVTYAVFYASGQNRTVPNFAHGGRQY